MISTSVCVLPVPGGPWINAIWSDSRANRTASFCESFKARSRKISSSVSTVIVGSVIASRTLSKGIEVTGNGELGVAEADGKERAIRAALFCASASSSSDEEVDSTHSEFVGGSSPVAIVWDGVDESGEGTASSPTESLTDDAATRGVAGTSSDKLERFGGCAGARMPSAGVATVVETSSVSDFMEGGSSRGRKSFNRRMRRSRLNVASILRGLESVREIISGARSRRTDRKYLRWPL